MVFVFSFKNLYFHWEKSELIPPAKRQHVVCIIVFVFLYLILYFCVLILYFGISFFVFCLCEKSELIPPAKRQHVVCIIDDTHLSTLQPNVLPLNYYKWPKICINFVSAINQTIKTKQHHCCIFSMKIWTLPSPTSNTNPNLHICYAFYNEPLSHKKVDFLYFYSWKFHSNIFFIFILENFFQHLERITSCLSAGGKTAPEPSHIFQRVKQVGNFTISKLNFAIQMYKVLRCTYADSNALTQKNITYILSNGSKWPIIGNSPCSSKKGGKENPKTSQAITFRGFETTYHQLSSEIYTRELPT